MAVRAAYWRLRIFALASVVSLVLLAITGYHGGSLVDNPGVAEPQP